MKIFNYEGQCPGGTPIRGEIEAESFEEAVRRLETMRILDVQVTESARPRGGRPVGTDDFIFFNEQLASLADAGVALDRGMREIARDVRRGRLRNTINAIASDLERGVPLDEAIAARESALPVLYSRVVRAGVKSGNLSAALLNLSQHLRFIAQTRWVVFESLAYPLTVLVLALTIVSVMLCYLVPQFREIVYEFGVALPPISRAVFTFARVYPFLLLFGGAVAAVFFLIWLLLHGTPAQKRLREMLVFRVPIIGRLLHLSLVARYMRSVSVVTAGGIPLPEALRLAAEATGSSLLHRDAEQVACQVERGERATDACRTVRLLPPVLGFVIDTTAARNTLPEAMTEMAAAYEMRAAHQQGLVRTWLAPLALIITGIGVGMCVLAMFMPLLSLVSSVSGG